MSNHRSSISFKLLIKRIVTGLFIAPCLLVFCSEKTSAQVFHTKGKKVFFDLGAGYGFHQISLTNAYKPAFFHMQYGSAAMGYKFYELYERVPSFLGVELRSSYNFKFNGDPEYSYGGGVFISRAGKISRKTGRFKLKSSNSESKITLGFQHHKNENKKYLNLSPTNRSILTLPSVNTFYLSFSQLFKNLSWCRFALDIEYNTLPRTTQATEVSINIHGIEEQGKTTYVRGTVWGTRLTAYFTLFK